MKIKLLTCVLLAAFVGLPFAFAGGPTNPEFINWDSFNVDTSVTIKTVTEMAGTTNETVMTTTMTEKTTDTIKLSTVITMNVQGQEMELPAQERTVEANPPEAEPVETPDNVTVTELDSGVEEVTVEAGTFECNWVKTKTEMEGMTTESTVWTSDEVPGMTVKMESHMEMAQGMTSDTTMELVEVTTGE